MPHWHCAVKNRARLRRALLALLSPRYKNCSHLRLSLTLKEKGLNETVNYLTASLNTGCRPTYLELSPMAQREEGWPLGLPLNARIGFLRNLDLSGSVSFRTQLTGSPTSSSLSSSDLDTESSGSFFHDNSITLGSLIGASSILELSQRSSRRRKMENTIKDQKNYKTSRPWLFSLCSKLSTDAVDISNTPSLGHFLEVERKAANVHRRNQSPAVHESGDLSPVMAMSEANSTLVGGHVDPHSGAALGIAGSKRAERELLGHGNGYGVPLLFPCMCGHLLE